MARPKNQLSLNFRFKRYLNLIFSCFEFILNIIIEHIHINSFRKLLIKIISKIYDFKMKENKMKKKNNIDSI